jgi:hypothetical protein
MHKDVAYVLNFLAFLKTCSETSEKDTGGGCVSVGKYNINTEGAAHTQVCSV